MSVGKRIKELRKKIAQTQSEFAKQLNCTQTNIVLYEKDEVSPTLKSLQIIKEAYNVDINWLISGVGNMFIQSPIKEVRPDELKQKVYDFIRNEFNLLQEDPTLFPPKKDDFWYLPISAEIAAGDPLPFNYDEDPMHYVPIAKSQLSNPADCDVLRVNGNSMEPKIEHSDLVVIKREQDLWSCNNKIVAVRTADGLTLKKLVLDINKNTACLVPFNPNYPIIIFDEDCSLCGYLKLLVRQC
jgi:SOS-response transcriptional repressor LexA